MLEIGEDLYTRRFGGERVDRSSILDAPGSGNPNATILADVTTGVGVPQAEFDCIIITQTLHMVYDVHGAVRTVRRALAPGGTVLATVPGITQIDAVDGPEKWFWGITQSAARRLFEAEFGARGVRVRQFGNVLAATAFLQGLALEEIGTARLDVVDPLFPVISCVRARRPRARQAARIDP